MCAHWETRGAVEGVEIVETLNGGSRSGENEETIAYAERYGWKRIGGSDSHIVSHIGRCATRFDQSIENIDGLVAALQGTGFEAVSPLAEG
jgi:predicted metal-dependent phosphoesterase TrpH